jgi:hypothetical protein
MTRSPHADPTVLMKVGNALVFAGPDRPTDRIVDFRSGEPQCASVRAAQSNSSGLTAIEADATTMLLLAQCIP